MIAQTGKTPLSQQHVNMICDELLLQRRQFGGSDQNYAFAKGMHPTTFSQLKNGARSPELMSLTKWLSVADSLGIDLERRPWQLAETEVYKSIRNDVISCKRYSKAMMLVDDPEIGKTTTGKHLARTLENCFYLDCSQSKSRGEFIRSLGAILGVKETSLQAMRSGIKVTLKYLDRPVVILDEAGDLQYTAFLDLKEFWNATDGQCGWYMMGADGLKTIIDRGMRLEKVGYREIFSRFSSKYMSIVPKSKSDRTKFYNKLIKDVLSKNCDDAKLVRDITRRCIANDGLKSNIDEIGDLGGLRRAETLLLLEEDERV